MKNKSSEKLIIYLDQNFISDIAKFGQKDKKSKIKPQLQALFSVIKEGVNDEKFLSPDSWIHAIETASKKNLELKKLIRTHQKYIGQVSLNPPWQIKEQQFINAFLDYCGIEVSRADNWKVAFRENPNKRMANFDISVNIGSSFNFNINNKESFEQIRRSGVKYADQYKKEIEATRKAYKDRIDQDFRVHLRHHKISRNQAEKFINSPVFIEIPNIDLFCKIWSKDLSNKNRRGLTSDENDIEMLSTYLPYCDILATDHYMKTLVESLGLDKKYKTTLFSMKDKDLNLFIKRLEDEKNKRKPANQSLFSVVCFTKNIKDTYEGSFLQKLSLAQNKFQNTGKYWNKEIYTSIFLVFDKEKDFQMPNRNKVRKNGLAALNENQKVELFIFASNFKKIYNTQKKKIEELVFEIPEHLRGSATAILDDETKFDHDVQEHDSYLFYDIENAINKGIDCTERYKIRIIYN